MDEVSRNEIEELQRAVRDLAGLVHSLQELGIQHHEAIKELIDEVRRTADVHA